MTVLPPVFDGLEEEAAQVVRNLLREARFEPGQVLFQQGESADRAFFVADGEVGIDVRLPGGAASRLTTVGAGDVLGELSLLSDSHRRTATATAVTEVRCSVMERRDLLAICAHYHPASPPVLGKLGDHVIRSIERVNRERLSLCRAPAVGRGDPRRAEPGARFDVLRQLPTLEFTGGFRADEGRSLLDAGELQTLESCGVPGPFGEEPERAWYVVLRGAVSMVHEVSDRHIRLSLVGPGRVAASDAFVGTGAVASREGATLLALSDRQVDDWRAGGARWTHRALEAFVRGLMDRLAEDTRALARERRQASDGFDTGGVI